MINKPCIQNETKLNTFLNIEQHQLSLNNPQKPVKIK